MTRTGRVRRARKRRRIRARERLKALTSIEQRLMPRLPTPLRARSKGAPFGSPYGMDYMDLIDNMGVTQAQVKAMREKFQGVYPAMKEFVVKHKVHVIVGEQAFRASRR